ncbi:hypothetical protein PAECIP111892_00241 [Paenibacillus auburnensis]|uniref:Uncharacterized protein n=1 Tax=Paenibacillus auburnensis TaxID=2905649 RepID=A0ABM9BMI4_9BACL|nr:hypothetical protein [Paenibacillus auburnensis]CAH1190552.1 hypothetical protein PAECIP111892_00241 [Paenibacillus auburnensis]
MKLFQMKTSPQGVERIKEFLEDNYLCIGYPGTGDLEQAEREDLRVKLLRSGINGEQKLEEAVDYLDLFVHEMQDGDYVLIADGDWVHLGDLGDYFYDDTQDNEEDGQCHRRGVTWLKSMPRRSLNSVAAELLAEEALISRYQGTLPSARLELWIEDTGADIRNSGEKPTGVDEDTLELAVAVLKEALHSGDAERRERAAIAILQYAR